MMAVSALHLKAITSPASKQEAHQSSGQTSAPSITIKAETDTLRFFIGGGDAAGKMYVDCGDGIMKEFPIKANDTTLVTVKTVDADTPVRVYEAGDKMNYFRCSAYGLTQLDFSGCTKMKWLLCPNNQLKQLDVSGLPELIYLECPSNDIDRLDVSGNPKLQTLIAHSNYRMGDIDLSKCPDMTYADLHSCRQVRQFNAANLPRLEYLSLDDTQVYTIDVSKNTELKTLNVSYTNITALDVSNNKKLDGLYITQKVSNHSKLRTLDVSKNTELTILFAYGQGLGSIDISNNTKLKSLYVSDNNFEKLDISNNPEIIELSANGNRLNFNTLPVPSEHPKIGLYFFTPQQNIRLDDIEYAEGGIIDISAETHNNKYKSAYKMFLTDSFDPAKKTQLKEGIDFTVEEGIVRMLKTQADSCYLEITNEAFPYLTLKTTKFMVLAPSDMGKNTLALEFTTNKAAGEEIRLNLSALEPKAKIFADFGDGELKEFTITSYINPFGEPVKGTLKSANVKVYTAKGVQLRDIQLPSLQISSISLLKSHALSTLDLSGNEITEIDLKGNMKMTSVNLDNNMIQSLSFPMCNLLTNIICTNNRLESMDVSKCIALQYLKISNNRLKQINLQTCDRLATLEAYGNKIEELDLSKCKELTELRLNDNELTSLDLLRNTKLENVQISDNRFMFSTMPETTCKAMSYGSQKRILLPKGSNVIDLSSEYLIDGKETSYQWKTIDGRRLFKDEDYTIEGGVTRFITTDIDSVYCEMTNATWPDLTLKTTNVKALGMPDMLVARFVSKEEAGTPVSLSIAATEPSYVFIDYGDGNLIERKLEHTSRFYDGTLGESKTVSLYTYKDAPCAIRVFSISSHAIKEIDLSRMTELECLNLSDTYLKNVDISNNTKLTELTLARNSLSQLDLSRHTALTMLNLSDCGISTFDLTKLTSLQWLAISNNGMESIDLSNQNRLWWLNVGGNKLKTIDVSGMPLLREFYCNDNKLEQIDLSKQGDMAVVNLSNNKFRFSTLPLHNINKLYCSPQADVETEAAGNKADLSSEATINGTPTEYKWFTASGTELTAGTDYDVSNGVTTFLTKQDEEVWCSMTNSMFSTLTLNTAKMKIQESAGITDIRVNDGTIDISCADKAIINVYDIAGNLVKSTVAKGNGLSVPAHNGVYIVETQSDGHKSVKKVVVRR